MKRVLKPAVSLATLLVCLLLGELCLELFAPVPDPYGRAKHVQPVNQYVRYEFPPNFSFATEPEEGLPGVHGHNLFTTNNAGFRGDYLATPKPGGEFRVFVIGGSTVECLYLDDAKSLTRVLQDELSAHAPAGVNVKVYGAGKSGAASDDHVAMITERIVHLEPDLVVVFSGVNDLTRSIYDYDYLHYLPQGEGQKLPLWHMLATEFQLPRRLVYLKARLSPGESRALEELPARSDYREKVRIRAAAPRTDARPRVETNAYAANLRTIIGVARAHNIRLVLMTQPSSWNSAVDPSAQGWHWITYRRGVTYREDYMDEALESFDDQTRRLSADNSVPLYDAAKSLPKSLEIFYDDVHFNENGARAAAEGLASLILEKNLLAPSR
ncbi:MAG: SGNH/GDSL hydrolase family protein [Acidobacteria bacterium]|nr:SGNH/GDSL hydrolase family protein [Acidobacteriota bacterium]